jgi:hypothetical protein
MTHNLFRGRFHSAGHTPRKYNHFTTEFDRNMKHPLPSNIVCEDNLGNAKNLFDEIILFSVCVDISAIATLATGREESSLNIKNVSKLGLTMYRSWIFRVSLIFS